MARKDEKTVFCATRDALRVLTNKLGRSLRYRWVMDDRDLEKTKCPKHVGYEAIL